MTKIHSHCLKRPVLSPRVQRDRHRGSSPEGCQQKVIRRRTLVCASIIHGLIGRQLVPSRNDFLNEARGLTVHDDSSLMFLFSVVTHSESAFVSSTLTEAAYRPPVTAPQMLRNWNLYVEAPSE